MAKLWSFINLLKNMFNTNIFIVEFGSKQIPLNFLRNAHKEVIS